MNTNSIESWGKYPQGTHEVIDLRDRTAPWPAFTGKALPFGNGRSYGDSCLNSGGVLLRARSLDRFIAFDPASGVVRCEAGVTLSEIIDIALPQGWFLPVTPGTRHVTVGGAIANDVHGKNHHVAGSFGHHVRAMELLRSDQPRLVTTPTSNTELFRATVGGLGLTGVITWAELQLRRVPGPWIEGESIRFGSLDEFWALSEASKHSSEYTVAWIDCVARGKALGRGHFLRGNHSIGEPGRATPNYQTKLAVPFTPPFSFVNQLTLKSFNAAYYWRQLARTKRFSTYYHHYFYPLDGIRQWNRMYGRKGFLQHQCVIPKGEAPAAIKALLDAISRSGRGSFLAVLKEFGDSPAAGLLSFSRPGTTLALDFPNDGSDVFSLLNTLDEIVCEAGGAIYMAKDARMSPETFRTGYPDADQFRAFIDPKLSSGLWRRITGQI